MVIVDGCLLLVRRGHAPAAGLWSVPGGHVEPGETPEAAVVRELAEETGLTVVCGEPVLDAIVAIDGARYWITDYRVDVVGSRELCPGDDAAAAEWVPVDEARRRPVVEGVDRLLTELGL